MEKAKRCMLATVLLLSVVLPGSAWADLHVDFDALADGSNAGVTQAGYESFRGAGSDSNTELDVSVTYPGVLEAGEDVTVRLVAQRWKNRDAISGGDETAVILHDLLEDFAGPVDGQTAVLFLGLPPGVFDITMYHHESSRSVPELANVIVTDADGQREAIELLSGHGSADASSPLVFTTSILSDGVNDVTFVYDNTDGTTPNAFPINGFDLAGATLPRAVDPNPKNNDWGVMPDEWLRWSCSGGACDSYDLYFGTDPAFDDVDFFTGLSEPFHNPGLLETATVYYWRVDTVIDSNSIPGSPWSFTTAGLAHDPAPIDEATGVSLEIDLGWTGDLIADSYDVYFDTVDASTWVGNVTKPTISVSLENDTTYYWRVVELDADGNSFGDGKVWSFTTAKSPLLVRLNDSVPIVDRSFDGVGANINGPSLIRVPEWIAPGDRADLAAVYYLYFASHEGENIRMAWAADIEGPYTMYNPDGGVLELGISVGSLTVSGHIASPDVHVDDENQRIIMYFHGGSVKWNGINRGQSTCVATSALGLDFNGGVEETIVGDFYYRVFEYGGGLYAIAKEGWTFKAIDSDNPWDPTGIDLTSRYLWERSATNAFADLGKTVRHNALVFVGDTLHVFYSCYPDMPERILHSTIDLTGDWNKWIASAPDEILEPELDWEGVDLPFVMSHSGSGTGVRQLRDPGVFEDTDGERYLLYSGRGEEAIGLARFISKCYIPVPGDMTGDCIVNMEDLMELADGWLGVYYLTDFVKLAGNWGVD